jgi:hypothetical protein
MAEGASYPSIGGGFGVLAFGDDEDQPQDDEDQP